MDKDLKMGLTKPIYKVLLPTRNGNFTNQWESCLEQLTDNIQKYNLIPIRVNIFIQSENQSDYFSKHALVKTSFLNSLGDHCPPFGVIMQEPEDPYHVICEVGFIEKGSAKITYGVFRERPYCIVDTENYKEYWTVGADTVNPDFNILASSNASFDYLNELYNHLGLSFDNIVRQWNYVGEILSKETEEGSRLRQHYQMFNESRSDYYGKYRQRKDFPAATGIGMLYQGVCIDSFAVSGDKNLKIVPISNPDQSESYKYGQEVLVGAPNQKLKQNQPPQFERAKLIALNKATRLIISGTASIIGQETIGVGDVEKQTHITIENILKLSTKENLIKHFPEIKSIPTNYSYARVYVKHKTDISKVRNICVQYFGNAAVTYVVADICRDDLLVEIEAELVS